MSQTSIRKPKIGRVFLFLFGNSLLTAGAASWIISIWFLAVVMALLEGFSWARILSVFMPESLMIVAVLVGVGWGVVVFVLDANFATLDTAKEKRGAREKESGERKRGWRSWARNRLLMGTLLRLVIVVLAMALTGPFLAQTFDERKVVQAIDAENAARIARYRADAGRAADHAIERLDARLQAARDEWVRETAGRSVSGRRGCGVTCRAMTTNIARLEGDLARARQEKTDRLAALAALSPARLERNEGVRLLPDNADTRAAIRKHLDLGSGQILFGLPASHVLASALFVLLFIAMVMLKIYQARTVAIYFDEHLQEMYEKYRRGGFADLPVTLLAAADRHDGHSPMGPQEFDAWYYAGFLAECDARSLHERILAVEGARRAAEQRRRDAEDRIVELRAEQWDLEAQHRALSSDIAQLEEQIVQNGHLIAGTRHTMLADRRCALANERRTLEDRADALDASALEIADKLEEVSNGIRVTEARMGMLGNDNRRHGRAAASPDLQALYQRHTESLAQRDAVSTDRKLLTNALAAVDEELGRLDRLLAPGAEPSTGDILYVDPVLRRLAEENKALEKQRDEMVSMQLRIAAKLSQVIGWTEELLGQAQADASHIAEFMARIRAMEVESSATPMKHAA